MRYYVDTCVWLNLFKKEGDATKGKPYWKLAEEFFEFVKRKGGVVFVSTIVLKERTYQLKEEYSSALTFFKVLPFIKIVKTNNEDYDLARRFEQEHGTISFYDYLHVSITKRMQASLVTRDADLIVFAKSHVGVSKPEELIG